MEAKKKKKIHSTHIFRTRLPFFFFSHANIKFWFNAICKQMNFHVD